jgi:tRNA threonylcarbamoyl adenosine modification protein (Sua5/YciO/YrdC/YwlC family)
VGIVIEDIRNASESERAGASKRAADAIRGGSLVAIPTETVYGVAARADDARAVGALRELVGLSGDAPLAWHAPSAEQPGAILPLRSGLHRRAVERLSNGPVTFMVDLSEDEAARVRTALGVAPGVIDDGKTLLVRVPGHPQAREIIDLVDAPVVVAGAAPKGQPAPTDARLSFDEPAQARIAMLLNDGPTTMRKPSTLVRLALDGSLHVVREGAVDERRLRKRLTRTVLFVCSGNTCRSPMAAAIMNHLVRTNTGDGSTDAPIHAESAGTGAMRGAPQTPEGASALRAMGIAPEGHSSRPLTRELIEDAERVFVMTPQHKRAAIDLAPELADRIDTLDPEGGMIPDPIGMSQEVYTETANRLRELIERRLREMDEQQPSAARAEGES